jgi:hypothetical protein
LVADVDIVLAFNCKRDAGQLSEKMSKTSEHIAEAETEMWPCLSAGNSAESCIEPIAKIFAEPFAEPWLKTYGDRSTEADDGEVARFNRL